jgi:hypothetical protein
MLGTGARPAPSASFHAHVWSSPGCTWRNVRGGTLHRVPSSATSVASPSLAATVFRLSAYPAGSGMHPPRRRPLVANVRRTRRRTNTERDTILCSFSVG